MKKRGSRTILHTDSAGLDDGGELSISRPHPPPPGKKARLPNSRNPFPLSGVSVCRESACCSRSALLWYHDQVLLVLVQVSEGELREVGEGSRRVLQDTIGKFSLCLCRRIPIGLEICHASVATFSISCFLFTVHAYPLRLIDRQAPRLSSPPVAPNFAEKRRPLFPLAPPINGLSRYSQTSPRLLYTQWKEIGAPAASLVSLHLLAVQVLSRQIQGYQWARWAE